MPIWHLKHPPWRPPLSNFAEWVERLDETFNVFIEAPRRFVLCGINPRWTTSGHLQVHDSHPPQLAAASCDIVH